MEAKKVVHLHFKTHEHSQTEYFFGSILAIYDSFPSDAIGIKYDSLCNALRSKTRYENKIVVINVGEIRRKKKTT